MAYSWVKAGVFVLPAVIGAGALWLNAYAPERLHELQREDQLIENLEAALYGLSAPLAMLISRRYAAGAQRCCATLYLFFALSLGLVFCEEISWGQRVFKLPTPGLLAKHNTQGEISLHNLKQVQDKLNLAFQLVGFGGTVSCLWGRRLAILRRVGLARIMPGWYLSLYFFLAFCICFILNIRYRMGVEVIWRDQEIAELLLALGFFIYTLSAWRTQPRPHPASAAADDAAASRQPDSGKKREISTIPGPP